MYRTFWNASNFTFILILSCDVWFEDYPSMKPAKVSKCMTNGFPCVWSYLWLWQRLWTVVPVTNQESPELKFPLFKSSVQITLEDPLMKWDQMSPQSQDAAHLPLFCPAQLPPPTKINFSRLTLWTNAEGSCKIFRVASWFGYLQLLLVLIQNFWMCCKNVFFPPHILLPSG